VAACPEPNPGSPSSPGSPASLILACWDGRPILACWGGESDDCCKSELYDEPGTEDEATEGDELPSHAIPRPPASSRENPPVGAAARAGRPVGAAISREQRTRPPKATSCHPTLSRDLPRPPAKIRPWAQQPEPDDQLEPPSAGSRGRGRRKRQPAVSGEMADVLLCGNRERANGFQKAF
jgi:hypothetical protein